jgi:hypothetical protein
MPVSSGPHVFQALGDGAYASAPFTPPAAPEVFTLFMMGTKQYGYSLLPSIDAPESGPCRPQGDLATYIITVGAVVM